MNVQRPSRKGVAGKQTAGEMGRVSLPSEIVIWSNLAGDCEQPARAGAGLRLAPNTYVNTWEADTTKVLSNTEMSDLAAAVGTGLLTDDMSEEEIEAAVAKLRYGKVVVLADADIDGCFTPETLVATVDGPVSFSS